MLLSPEFSLSLFNAPCHDALLLDRSDVPLSKRPDLPMFLGGILSLLFRPAPHFRLIPVPLSRLVICGVILLMVLDGFICIPLIAFLWKSIIILSPFVLFYEGGHLITVYLSINESACLVSANDHFVRTRCTYRKLFRPYSYRRQQYMFHPSAVGVCLFIHH